jgi:hypothetical protein
MGFWTLKLKNGEWVGGEECNFLLRGDDSWRLVNRESTVVTDEKKVLWWKEKVVREEHNDTPLFIIPPAEVSYACWVVKKSTLPRRKKC